MSHPESYAYFIGTSITTDNMGVYKGMLAVVKTVIMSASVCKLEVLCTREKLPHGFDNDVNFCLVRCKCVIQT